VLRLLDVVSSQRGDAPRMRFPCHSRGGATLKISTAVARLFTRERRAGLVGTVRRMVERETIGWVGALLAKARRADML
jgi:hypothetical protein